MALAYANPRKKGAALIKGTTPEGVIMSMHKEYRSMSGSEIYSPPEASLESDEITKSNKAGALLIFFSIVLTVPLMASQFFVQYGNIGLAGGIGGSLGALIPALLVVLLFQIGKKFRNSKSRWKIFMWSQAIFLLGQITTLLKFIGQNA
jgi:hypothetical protein